jgi:hypothetical protein
VRTKTTTSWTESCTPRDDASLATLAERQYGVVSLAQLRELGWSDSAVRSRAAAGVLHRVHSGVYAVGHPLLPRKGELMAAVLACGPRSALSHFAGAELLGLWGGRASPIDIRCATGAGQCRSGIRAHRGKLLRRDVITVDSIPSTSVPRTILDLAERLTPRQLERVVDQAEVQRLLHMREMEDLLARANGRRGVSQIRTVLALEHEPAFTKSEIEELMLALCDDTDLPRPLTNKEVEGEKVDFHWPDYLLIAEADSKRWHGTTRRREKDIARDRKLQLARWRVLRFSWREIALTPAAVAAELAPFLREPVARRIAS